MTHVNGSDHKSLILQALDYFRVALRVVAGEVDADGFVPRANLHKAVLLQLDDLQLEVSPQAVLIELNLASQAGHLHLARNVNKTGFE